MYPIDQDFGRKVCGAYTSSLRQQKRRESWYGKSIAREWKRGSTPEAAREAWSKDQDRLWEIFTTTEEEYEDEESWPKAKPRWGIFANGEIRIPPRRLSGSPQSTNSLYSTDSPQSTIATFTRIRPDTSSTVTSARDVETKGDGYECNVGNEDARKKSNVGHG
ncbi:MAG: hypothetical protein L6R40_008302 [Gallowayella cf. fulva]|nr:MAG: hypothetical protein L6R40_008302 [Xanthomendoza cf. fulva]